jgi:hypothetical protein
LLKSCIEIQFCDFFFVSLRGKNFKDGKEEDTIHQSGDISLRPRQRTVIDGKEPSASYAGT